MENASKALIMACSILLGVMIMSVGAALFNSFAGFSSDIINEIENAKIAQFNTQFLKYYGYDSHYDEKKEEYIKTKKKLTIHDVVTLANLAKKNNIEYDVQNQNVKSENSYYVQINLNQDERYKNLEKAEESELTQLIKDNDMVYSKNNELINKYYYIFHLETSKITGRVIYLEISELRIEK